MFTPPPMDMLKPCCAQFAADHGSVEEGGVGVPAGGGTERGGQQRCVTALVGGHADADGGVGEIDVGDAEAVDARHEACAEVRTGGDGSAGAENAPSGSMDHLNLFVERHLADHQVGALIGRESLVHPSHGLGHLRCVWTGLGLGRKRAKGEKNGEGNKSGSGEQLGGLHSGSFESVRQTGPFAATVKMVFFGCGESKPTKTL